jgi:hypothetical protein
MCCDALHGKPVLGDGVELAIVSFGIDTPEAGSADVRQTRAKAGLKR